MLYATPTPTRTQSTHVNMVTYSSLSAVASAACCCALQMMMPPQYVLGTADMVKTAFAGEAEGLTTVAPSGLMSSRECLQHVLAFCCCACMKSLCAGQGLHGGVGGLTTVAPFNLMSSRECLKHVLACWISG